MTDSEFVAALESCTLPETSFRHADHVRAAYLFLKQARFPEALARMTRAIRRYAESRGKANLYHETITIAFLAVINERMHTRGDGDEWEGFAGANPDLLDKRFLSHYYRHETLHSQRAREVFVLGEFSEKPHDAHP
jgi:hypothetical protein